MSLGVLTGSLLLVISNIGKDGKSGVYQFSLLKTGLNPLLFILLIFLFFQIVPLPDALLRFFSLGAKVVGEKSIPPLDVINSNNHNSEWFSISPYLYPVRMSIIRWTVYCLFFLGLTQMLNSRKRIELTIFLILMTGCFEAIYGLMQTYSGYNHIWWYKKEVGLTDVTGTYINRNHFAGLMEMCLLLAAAYAAGLSERKRKTRDIKRSKSRLRARLSSFLSGEQRFNKRAFILFAGAVMGIGLVFSASRGGLISAAGGMLCMGLLFFFRKGLRQKGFVILFLFLIISTYALRIGVEHPVERFDHFGESFKTRARWAQNTLYLFGDYKLSGVGVGNFQYAYPKYQAGEDAKSFINYAHNDWAQFLAEGGIIGFCLLVAGISYYLYRIMSLWKKRRDPFAICLGIAPLAAMTAIAIHSYSDFNLHIPANFLMLSAIVAIGYSALHMEGRHGREKMLYRYHIIPLRYKGILVLLMILGFMAWVGSWTIRHFVAECYCHTVTHYSTLNRDQNPPLKEIQKAIGWDQGNAVYWSKMAWELTRIRDREMGDLAVTEEGRYRRQMEIISAFEGAAKMNPFISRHHLRLGLEYTMFWQKPDRRQRWLPAADIAMQRAAYFAGENQPYLHEGLGDYWIMRSKTIQPPNPVWYEAWEKAFWHYKEAGALRGEHEQKKMIERIKRHIRVYYPDETFIQRAIERISY